jgi:sterol desaturase/sphingolipid hydroxylase (fatty acid hydroxylase superfamily)
LCKDTGAMLDDIMTLRPVIFAGGLALFMGLETWRPARPWTQSRLKRSGFHFAILLFNSVLVRFLVIGPLMLWLTHVEEKHWGFLHQVDWPVWCELAVALVVLDAFDYWWHRWNHGWRLLWFFHRVHHSDTHIDTSTSLRFHPGELLISGLVEAGWILALGPTLPVYAAFKVVLSSASQFHHSNVDLGDRADRWLKRIVVTPRFHAHHHIVELNQNINESKASSGANYSAILSCWDWIFRSVQLPERISRGTYGLATGRERDLSLRAAILSDYD